MTKPVRELQVTTRHVPATDTQGSRIRARGSDGREKTIPYPYEANNAHIAAVRALVASEDAEVTMLRESPRGYVFRVRVPAE